MIVACGSPRTSGQTDAASQSRPPISQTPSPPSTSPPLVSLQSPAPFQACRLPVIAVQMGGEPPGGWLTLPAGTFQRDASSVGVDSFNGVSWDEAVHRWVPADAKSVSPDGRSYFVADRQAIVDAATGATIHEIPHANAVPGMPIGFTSQGVYLQAVGMQGQP
jgi:hypothetical protein